MSTNKLNSNNSDVKNFFDKSSDTKIVDSNTEIKGNISAVTKKEEPNVKKYFRFLEFKLISILNIVTKYFSFNSQRFSTYRNRPCRNTGKVLFLIADF